MFDVHLLVAQRSSHPGSTFIFFWFNVHLLLISMKKNAPHILLVNPWIHDFAAYDFWAKPAGLLILGAILRDHGYHVLYIDCLDRFHPNAAKTDITKRYGRGPYLKTRIPKPESLKHIPRNYSRYGIKYEWFEEDLRRMKKPDLILVTSLMTYWYPGVQETIECIRKVFPDVFIVLGGIYSSLCSNHASSNSGADKIAPGPGEASILSLVGKHTGLSVKPTFDFNDLDTYPYPAYDLQNIINYIPVMTSRGCPFSCTYCASNMLNPNRMVRDPKLVAEEIFFWHKKYKVTDFVFYDDALLVNAEKHALPLFEEIIKSGFQIRFHTPNAIHVREITKKSAELMKKAGFHTMRLGLETAAFENRDELDTKVTEKEFKKAIDCLKQAGFKKNHVGAYLLAGLPDQTKKDIANSINIVNQNDITPVLAYYSPIPHTALWEKAKQASKYDLESDPIFTNNAILPCMEDGFSWETVSSLKKLVNNNAGNP